MESSTLHLGRKKIAPSHKFLFYIFGVYIGLLAYIRSGGGEQAYVSILDRKGMSIHSFLNIVFHNPNYISLRRKEKDISEGNHNRMHLTSNAEDPNSCLMKGLLQMT